jgi:2-polyprenyl-6-methoxyphenol hydroxylase-like FAD-dependent oxidoreductase
MKAVVAGAGPIGLATAMLLAGDGWEVLVFDKDEQEPPDTAEAMWADWERRGVAQFRMPHVMMPRFRHLLDAEFPEVRDRLEVLGGRRFNLTEILPRSLPDRAARPGDERFETLTARRPVVEAAFAAVAQETSRVEIVRGVGVEAPIDGRRRRPDVPHVGGVRASTGENVAADLVVDAMGRRSKASEWIVGLGGRAPFEEAVDAGFAYYAMHFRSRNAGVPEFRGPLA